MEEEIKALREKIQQLELIIHQTAQLGSCFGPMTSTFPSNHQIGTEYVPLSGFDNGPDASPPALVSMTSTRVINSHLIVPSECNPLGICMGGTVLSLIDIAAGLAAKALVRGPCVTACLDNCHFLRPSTVGNILLVASMVNRTFTSSLEVGVRVEEEDPATGQRWHCCSAYLTFVSLDARSMITIPSSLLPQQQRSKPCNNNNNATAADCLKTKTTTTSQQRKILPAVVPSTPHQRNVYADAARRREARLTGAIITMTTTSALSSSPPVSRLLPLTHRSELQPVAPPPPSFRSSFSSLTRETISPGRTRAHMTCMVLPQHANSIGVTFGGTIMGWIEKCAFIAAARVARSNNLLTACMDEIQFKAPTKIGDTVFLEAEVTASYGGSSLEVMVSIWGETTPVPGAPMFHCGDAFATIVSLNGEGRPVKELPVEVRAETEEERGRSRKAEERREQRLALRKVLLDHSNRRPSLDMVESI